MLKKPFTLLLSLLLLCLSLTPAFADLVWEPSDDFWVSHRSECTKTGDDPYFPSEDFEAQAQIRVVKSPEDHTPVKTIEPGESFGTAVKWDKHPFWRLLSDESGWIVLENAKRYYTERDFLAEHEDELVKPETEEKVAYEYDTVAWLYPGSATHSQLYSLYELTPDGTIEYKYTDQDGRIWAQMGFIYQQSVSWICLSDPYSTDLPANAPEFASEEYPPAPRDEDPAYILTTDETKPTAPSEEPAAEEPAAETPVKKTGVALPIILVVSVMLLTGVLIVLLSRKNKRRQ